MIFNFSHLKKMFAFGIVAIVLPFGSAQAIQPSAPAVNSGVNAGTSLNWSGYDATGGPFTSITGTWIIPAVPLATSTEADATWVGIGGVTGQDLIQAGTQAIVNDGNSGGVTYQAWYETLPQATEPVALTVSPGNSITATLTETGTNLWQVSLRNNTTGQSYVGEVPYSSSLSSAEWVEEMPTDVTTLVPLDNFGSVGFANATAVLNGNTVTIAGANANPITMVTQSGQTLASPSAIGSDGESFAVTRSGVSAASSGVAPGGIGRAWRRTGVGIRGFSPRVRVGQGNGMSGVATSVSVLGIPAVGRLRGQFLRILQEFRNMQGFQNGSFRIGR